MMERITNKQSPTRNLQKLLSLRAQEKKKGNKKEQGGTWKN